MKMIIAKWDRSSHQDLGNIDEALTVWEPKKNSGNFLRSCLDLSLPPRIIGHQQNDILSRELQAKPSFSWVGGVDPRFTGFQTSWVGFSGLEIDGFWKMIRLQHSFRSHDSCDEGWSCCWWWEGEKWKWLRWQDQGITWTHRRSGIEVRSPWHTTDAGGLLRIHQLQIWESNHSPCQWWSTLWSLSARAAQRRVRTSWKSHNSTWIWYTVLASLPLANVYRHEMFEVAMRSTNATLPVHGYTSIGGPLVALQSSGQILTLSALGSGGYLHEVATAVATLVTTLACMGAVRTNDFSELLSAISQLLPQDPLGNFDRYSNLT